MTQTERQKITGLVITLNEEKNIESIIENLSFVDEIIIVDSFSQDRTLELIQKYPHVKVFQNKFENYSAQRNIALQKASHPWIIFLDADERISDALRDEIRYTLENNPKHSAYHFYRKFMFKKTHLRFSGWQTDKNIRLFKKDNAFYTPSRLVHEKLVIEGSVGKLENKLIHFSYENFKSYKSKMVAYGKLKAKEKFVKNYKPFFLKKWFHPLYNFLYNYIIRLGILDGYRGIIICHLNAYSVRIRYRELENLWKNNKAQQPSISKI